MLGSTPPTYRVAAPVELEAAQVRAGQVVRVLVGPPALLGPLEQVARPGPRQGLLDKQGLVLQGLPAPQVKRAHQVVRVRLALQDRLVKAAPPVILVRALPECPERAALLGMQERPAPQAFRVLQDRRVPQVMRAPQVMRGPPAHQVLPDPLARLVRRALAEQAQEEQELAGCRVVPAPAGS